LLLYNFLMLALIVRSAPQDFTSWERMIFCEVRCASSPFFSLSLADEVGQ
jgi:hypothetical protein